MMEELAVKIKIGDRIYPMQVLAADEARVRQVGKLINEKIKAYSEKFGIHDKQDLLAMVAFDCLVATAASGDTQQRLAEQIKGLEALVDQAL